MKNPENESPQENRSTETEGRESAEKKPLKERVKRTIIKVVVILGFLLIVLIGVMVSFYPQISNYVNEKNQSRVVDGYREAVEQLDDTDYESYLNAARDYNARLASSGSHVRDAYVSASDEDMSDEYWNLLDVSGRGLMGYIEIDILDIRLPLYHGTSEAALATGAGHIVGSSLPVGGESTHTAVSAHTGLPRANFFTGVDLLEKGDTFQLIIMNEVLTYEVDQIVTVLPDEVDELTIVPGEDYATLVTCTPYGINSHRLLVRGTRIETPPERLVEIAVGQDNPDAERSTWLATAQKNVVAFLSSILETVAEALVSCTERGMDLFGVEY